MASNVERKMLRGHERKMRRLGLGVVLWSGDLGLWDPQGTGQKQESLRA